MAIKVDQTRMNNVDGNCMAACIATIFEMPLDECEDWYKLDGNWYLSMIRWFAKHNIAVMKWGPHDGWVPDGWAILGGRSPRGDWGHAIVTFNGKNYHDPHPSREGVRSIYDWTEFWVLDPDKPCPLLKKLQKSPQDYLPRDYTNIYDPDADDASE